MQQESTIVYLFDDRSSCKCGYCNSESRSVTGTICDPLDVSFYEIICNRGWRRSGNYVYKPLNKQCCCPQYTIKCDALNFRLSRSQKRVMENFVAFINEGIVPAFKKLVPDDKNSEKIFIPEKSSTFKLIQASGDAETVDNENKILIKKSLKSTRLHSAHSSESKIVQNSKNKENKAKFKRFKAKLEKLKNVSDKTGKPYEMLLESYKKRRLARLSENKSLNLEEYMGKIKPKEEAKYFIDIRLVRCSGSSEEFIETFDQSFKLYKEYQTVIHKDDPDELNKESFKRFLVDSPLIDFHNKRAVDSNGPPEFGTYHQQYWLNGKQLIAVGVIDLLPGYLSSVYFYYKPAYNFLRLGVISALKEIAYVRELYNKYSVSEPSYANFKEYCMGYYIHSCVKMRYKGRYKPSYLACPETYRLVPIKDCIKKLDEVGKYARFSDLNDNDPDSLETVSINEVEQRILLRIPSRKLSASKVTKIDKTHQDYRIVSFSSVKKYLTNLKLIMDWAQHVGISALDGNAIIDLT